MAEVVQSLWIGPRLPLRQVLSIRSFLQNGHEYHLYAYDPIEGVPAGVTVRDAGAVIPREAIFCYQNGFGKGSYSAFSNVFRYQLIFNQGGWWVDTDVVCLRPFDFEADYVFALEYEQDFTAWTASCVFKSPAQSDLLKHCLDVCKAKDKMKVEWGEIGPHLLDQSVKQFGLARYALSPRVFNPVNWFEVEQLVSPDFDLSRLNDSYAVHLWDHMWTHVDLETADSGSPGSLYGRLKGRYMAADVQGSGR